MVSIERVMYAFGALEAFAFAALLLWLLLRSPAVGVVAVIGPLILVVFGALCARQAREASS